MTTKKELLDRIRKTCLRCCCGSYKAVQECQTEKDKLWHEYEACPLFPFRMGIDPNPARSEDNLLSNFAAQDK